MHITLPRSKSTVHRYSPNFETQTLRNLPASIGPRQRTPHVATPSRYCSTSRVDIGLNAGTNNAEKSPPEASTPGFNTRNRRHGPFFHASMEWRSLRQFDKASGMRVGLMDLTVSLKSIDFDKVGRVLLLCFSALIVLSFVLACFCCTPPFTERSVEDDPESNHESDPLLAGS